MRPHCELCQTTEGRDVAIIAHSLGEEIQFDWLELQTPLMSGLLGNTLLLVGALPHSGRLARSTAATMSSSPCSVTPGGSKVDGLVNMAESFDSAVVDELGQPV